MLDVLPRAWSAIAGKTGQLATAAFCAALGVRGPEDAMTALERFDAESAEADRRDDLVLAVARATMRAIDIGGDRASVVHAMLLDAGYTPARRVAETWPEVVFAGYVVKPEGDGWEAYPRLSPVA